MTFQQIESLQVGSVVVHDGQMRVVRAVHRYRLSRGHCLHTSVTFAIKRRSWTNRPYTVYGWQELTKRNWVATDRVMPLDSSDDRELARNIADSNYRTMWAADVRGWP